MDLTRFDLKVQAFQDFFAVNSGVQIFYF